MGIDSLHKRVDRLAASVPQSEEKEPFNIMLFTAQEQAEFTVFLNQVKGKSVKELTDAELDTYETWLQKYEELSKL